MGFFALAGLVLSAIGTAVGMTVQISAAQQQAKLQQAQANMQADSLREQAKQEEQNQLQRSFAERRLNARKLAAAEAGYAASGLSLEGTPSLSVAGMADELELEAQMQEAASGAKRRLLLADADNARAFGGASASLTRSSGLWSAAGTGLAGLGDLAGKAYNADKKNMFKDF